MITFGQNQTKMKKRSNAAINAKRAEVIIAGTDVEVTGYGVVALQGRPEDQSTLQGLAFAAQIQLSVSNVTPIDFLDRNNDLHSLSPQQMIEVWSKGAAYMSAIYQLSWNIKKMNPPPADINDSALWVVP